MNRRQRFRQYLARFAGLCYLLCAGIVPAGHMAAPLASGTAFHLCPGDARSALLIDALAAQNTDQHAHHHHHHAQSAADPAKGTNAAATMDDTSADPGCFFSGGSALLATSSSGIPATAPQLAVLPAASSSSLYRQASWLRPPVRSPPN